MTTDAVADLKAYLAAIHEVADIGFPPADRQLTEDEVGRYVAAFAKLEHSRSIHYGKVRTWLANIDTRTISLSERGVERTAKAG